MVKTPCFHNRGCGFESWLGNRSCMLLGEREREREKKTEREKKKERERDGAREGGGREEGKKKVR